MVWYRTEIGSVKLTFRKHILLLNSAPVWSNENNEKYEGFRYIINFRISDPDYFLF